MDARVIEEPDEAALRAFVDALPACHLGLRAASRRETGGRFFGAFEGGALVAVVYAAPGASVVVAGDPRGVSAATRVAAPRSGTLRRLVGRETESLACAAAWPGPRPILRRHLHMSLSRAPEDAAAARLRRAGVADLRPVLALQREFHADDDPPGAAPPDERALEASVRARIAAGATWFLGAEPGGGGAPVWKAEVAFEEPEGAMLAGVVTSRAQRGRGIATRGLAAVSAATLARGPARVTLHVAEGNATARAVYERVGFRVDDAFLVAYARAAT